ncbi:hypothetical protein [Pseudomonas coronafaciens]|uniref:competence protein CoiA family protein n=1 Tax=Pseudomonas coronafaciens TaxID=53409 RepID=UPI0011C36DA9|nr:hypothetical protein [Pseudomonas coronafaciens]
MQWAINYSGDHVRAGAHFAEQDSLRCPSCNRRVYHRQGSSRQAHFAHFSGNANQECELYYPGVGVSHIGAAALVATDTPLTIDSQYLGTAALVWREGQPIPLSLMLRIPQYTNEEVQIIQVDSSLGQHRLNKESLKKVTFSAVELKVPPAEIKLSPANLTFEDKLKKVLRNFKHEDNFFRYQAGAGALIAPNVAIELGETYFIVTQRQLSSARPDALKLLSTRVNKSWTVYQVKLRDVASLWSQDIISLRGYLGRTVIPPRSKVEFIWPAPVRFDPDGSPVYDYSVCQILARSNSGPPLNSNSASCDINVSHVGDDLYAVSIAKKGGEVLIEVHGGISKTIRFEQHKLARPEGVNVRSGGALAGLHTMNARNVLNRGGLISITVPSDLIWRLVRINQKLLSPYPSALTYESREPVIELDAGAFGRVLFSLRPEEISKNVKWPKTIELIVISMGGRTAYNQLLSVTSKGQLLSWVARNQMQIILPLMLQYFSKR